MWAPAVGAVRVRFAPSPSGQLHVGNARTALFNWFLARGAGGSLVLRIEDTDLARSSAAAEVSILDDLRWLGLDWDEGPDVGGSRGPYRQSDRLDLYVAHAEQLVSSGQAYRCFCTPAQLEAERRAALAAGRPARYSGACRALPAEVVARRLSAGEPAALRFRVPPGDEVRFEDQVRGEVRVDRAIIGDPVILRSAGRPAYNFAVVVDDALMGITHVVRGEDHLSNTPRQLLLYHALGLEAPRFAHLSLVVGADHAPLAKRHGATSVAEFRAKGYLPEALVNYLALLGWSPGHDEELLPLEELARRFSLADVGRRPGIFDQEKLAWVNRHYLARADENRLTELSLPFLREAGYVDHPASGARAYLTRLVPAAAGSLDSLRQVPERLAFLFEFDAARSLARPDVRAVLAEPVARAVVRALADELAAAPRLTRDEFRAVAGRVRARVGARGRALFHPIRVALTGQAGGMELDLAVPAIDQGAELGGQGLRQIVGCRERVTEFAAALDRAGADLDTGTDDDHLRH